MSRAAKRATRAGNGRYTPPKTGASPVDRRVAWYAPIYNVSGYADEARNFIKQLRDKGVDVAARALGTVDSAFVTQLVRDDPGMAAVLSESQGRPVVAAPLGILHVTGDVAVANIDTQIRVVRTMYETDRLPELWVKHLNTVDELWVPSSFNAETFARAGVTTHIEVVPGGVDTEVFHPDLEPLPIDGAHGTVFLSVFEWSQRKGPDVLLRAFAEAFTSKDDVTLVLRSYPRGHFTSLDASAAVERLIDAELAHIGVARGDCATIIVLGQHVSPAELPRLIRAADAYVSPTRGEGWGRPLMEAMACGRPVIATAWSGQSDFLDSGNSLPITVDRLVEVGETMDIAHYRGHYWAEPSASHLAERLAFVHAHPGEAARLGQRARADVVARWQWPIVAESAERRINALLAQAATVSRNRARSEVDARLVPAAARTAAARTAAARTAAARTAAARTAAARTAAAPVPVRIVGDFDGLHSLARVNRALAAVLTEDGRLSVEIAATDGPGGARRHLSAAIEVRHHWPPDFSPVERGTALVMMMPWELSVIPQDWVAPLERTVDQVWTYSNHTRNAFLRAGIPAEMVQVVPLGVDTTLFRPDGERYPLHTGKSLRLLYVGGTIPRKGFDVALSAYLHTFDRSDDVCLVVKPFLSAEHYKGMNLDAALMHAAADTSHPEIEVITDTNLSDEDLAGLYRSCDVLLAPYRGEGFGLPILEAMASGLPAVVTDHGAALDFCDGTTSYLVAANEVPVAITSGELPAKGHFTWAEPDPVALSSALRSLQADTQLRSSRATASYTRATAYAWSQTGERARARIDALTGIRPKADDGLQGRRDGLQGRRRPPAADRPERAPLLLSACMIVKDEEPHIAACLSTVSALVDEVVIGDTGSTDATPAIARALGATVIDVPWTDDFAAARNQVLRHCRGRWILWIDADERFKGDTKSLRAVLENAPSEAFLVPIENLEGHGIEGSTTHNAVRLFSRHLSFSGRVHEQVVRPDRRPVVAPLLPTIQLIHLGYLTETFEAKGKRARNLALAELAFAEAKTADARAEAEMNLGRSCLLAGNRAAGLAYLDHAAEAENPTVARASLHAAVLAAIDAADFPLADSYLVRLEARCRADVLPAVLRGTIACHAGQLEEALRCLLPFAAPAEDDDHVPRGGSDIAPLLAKCYRNLGNPGAAADVGIAELRAKSRYAEPLHVMVADMKAAGRNLAELGRALPAREIKLFLAQILAEEPDDGLAVLDGVLESHPGELAVLAAAGQLAQRGSVAQALRWSILLASREITARPILDLARDGSRSPVDRALAAASTRQVFGGDEPETILASLLEDASPAEGDVLRELVAPILDAGRPGSFVGTGAPSGRPT